MTVTREQLLADPHGGARPLDRSEQAEWARNAQARPWRPVAAPAAAHGQRQPPAAATGRAAPAAPASGPHQRSQVRSRDGVAAHPRPQRTPANGSMWRLRSLIAMGHTTGRIAATLGTTTSTINPFLTGQRHTVAVPLRDDITRLFDAWWDKHPPQATPADKTAAIRALGDAAVHNWPCPAALNEDQLDTPGYQPTDRWRYSKGTGPAAEDPLGKHRDLATNQRHAGLAAAQAEPDAAGAGWRIRQPRHQAQAQAEPEAV
jgi:hypothetical protein